MTVLSFTVQPPSVSFSGYMFILFILFRGCDGLVTAQHRLLEPHHS